jgi:CIC family chloride channel protein
MIDVPAFARRAPVRTLAALRLRMRSSELWLIALSVAVGLAAGVLAVVQARAAHGLQQLLYGIGPDDRLSAIGHISVFAALWLPIGGLALGIFTWAARRRRPGPLVDVVEANALYGGALSSIDSTIVCAQTVLSNGVGASVGLEAGYAQAGGAAASWAGRRLKLRRHDLRILLGAGAGAAIAAAFGAPLTGAFYAFEIVIGSYTPSAIAPVAASCLAGAWAANTLGGARYEIHIHAARTPDILGYVLFAGLGLLCALAGVAIVRLVAGADQLVRRSPIPAPMRPAVGGLIVAGLALVSPQVLSAGHGALHLDLAVGVPLAILAVVFLMKVAASVATLGFGFRGGLFFASLFLGSLLGQIYAGVIDLTAIPEKLSPENAALVGMATLAVAVVGGPLTMSFLVLESTQDFGVTAATLAATLIASSIVRERFGYSFSTWRLHLRGETIRSARDVGWIRTLTAGRMMRRDPQTIAASASLAEFRRRFPLGSTQRVILLDDAGRYAGLVITASAYGENVSMEAAAASLAVSEDITLSPDLNIADVMRLFETTETDELAVVDPKGQVLGLLAEAYVTRRYASELERQHLDLYGEGRD